MLTQGRKIRDSKKLTLCCFGHDAILFPLPLYQAYRESGIVFPLSIKLFLGGGNGDFRKGSHGVVTEGEDVSPQKRHIIL